MSNLNLSLAISPCPNDTFLFESLVGDVRTAGGSVDFLDIAQLNALHDAPAGPDVVKVSCASAPLFHDRYRLLRCGGAFAKAVGPLVLHRPEISGVGVGLPGQGTTAHILWRMWCRSQGIDPHPEEFERFDRIPGRLAAGDWRRAVVIHESRFTFREAGLVEEADLGAFWDGSTGLPVPLGCVLIRRELGEGVARRVAQVLVEGAKNAMERQEPSTPFVREHAAEMSADIQALHIRTYANERSLDCGSDGLAALLRLWEEARAIRPWDLESSALERWAAESVGI
ncbi:MAG: 1,4-dihydroxy-6-naphthoate synthase [Fibrobacterota bacterium]|nr:1,4-dihydroxy-6-naphthoate synthase [Fibrobacterota bacterium]QQS03111.1 MAG: 1,4-dihydroxy-6-naphthoate synthase [Fibrobacterota bacterium]